MSVRGRTVPSFVVSIGAHALVVLVLGIIVGVGPTKTFRLVEMAVNKVARAVNPEPPAPAPRPRPEPNAPVRARRSRPTTTPPSSAAPQPAIDTGPSAPDAPDTAMPASQGPAVPDGDPNGVLGGSTAPNAVSPSLAPPAPPPPPPERRIYDMGDLDAPPSLVGTCTAEVPAFARQTNQSGWVMVQFTLDPDGRVQTPRVRASSPAGVFDQAALDAIRRCRYTAPRVGGRPVAVTYRQRLRFEP